MTEENGAFQRNGEKGGIDWYRYLTTILLPILILGCTLNESLQRRGYQGLEQKLNKHGGRLGRSLNSGEYKLGLSEYHDILKR